MTWEPTPAGVVCLSMIVRDEAAVIERALDFGHNRSELMGLARGAADYLLLLDADMTVTLTEPLPDRLAADSYLVREEGKPGYRVKHWWKGMGTGATSGRRTSNSSSRPPTMSSGWTRCDRPSCRRRRARRQPRARRPVAAARGGSYYEDELPLPPRAHVDEAACRTVALLDAEPGASRLSTPPERR
jgi:hypothetical protein